MTPEEYYRQILETTSHGIVVVSRDMTVREINRNALAMFNVEQIQAVGRTLDQVVPEQARQALEAIVTETFEEGFALNEEIKYWFDTGFEIELGILGSLIVSPKGKPEAVVVCKDMTARRELERLRRIDQSKSDYVNHVAHELRNPLTTIQAYSETAAAMVGGEAREFLQTVEEECTRMMALIKEMLAVSRLESGALKLDLHPADLVTLVEQCVAQVQSHSECHTLALTMADAPRGANIDADKIKEVVLNLLENAVKYSPDGGEIAIHVGGNEQMLSVAVADSGLGIDREHLGHLFEKFYRVDSPATRGISGTGLGLAITKGIVDAHGGTLTVDSEPGKGSTFTVELPAANKEPATSAPARSQGSQ